MLQQRLLYLYILALVLCFEPASSWAQEAAPGGNSPVVAQAAPSAGLQEIVVTAEKRSENIEKAPLVITAVDADTLASQHVVNSEDLMEVAPELHVDFGGPAPTFSLRGIGSSVSGPNGSPGVTVNQDGTYMGTLLPQLMFYDVQRVEVTAGPQGTLWGGNSTGGTINIITNKPTDKLGGYATLEAGNFGLARFEGALNVPITDTVAVRAAGTFLQHSGWLNDGYDDADDTALRMTLLAKPTSDLSIRLEGDYSNRGGQGDNVYIGPRTTGPNSPLTSSTAWSVPGSLPTDQRVDYTDWSVQGEVNYDLHWATLTYLPDYRVSTQNLSNSRFLDFFLTSLATTSNTHIKTDTQELRLTSDEDKPLQWVAGLYYYNLDEPAYATTAEPASSTVGAYTAITTGDLGQDSYAGFGQATYSVLDWLRITGGLRYTEDQIDDTFGAKDAGGPNINLSASTAASFYALTWKASVEADVTDKSMVYFTTGTGYTTGVLNTDLLPSLQHAAPEKVMHYEIGSKNRFLNNHLQLNADGFYDSYRNYDTFTTTNVGVLAPGTTANVVGNAGTARIYGGGLTADYLVTDDDRLGASLDYLNATFTDFPSATPLQGLGAPKSVNYKGNAVPDSVPWSSNLSYEHIFEMANGANLSARVDSRISSAFWLTYQEWPGTKQPAYTKTELSLTYNAPDNRWSIMGYVKNIEDAAVVNRVNLSPNVGGVNVLYGVDSPRLFGVILSAKY